MVKKTKKSKALVPVGDIHMPAGNLRKFSENDLGIPAKSSYRMTKTLDIQINNGKVDAYVRYRKNHGEIITKNFTNEDAAIKYYNSLE